MTRLSEAIRAVLADRQVTDAEVMGQLAPIINSEGVADPTELQPLANAWADPSVVFDGVAAARVGRILTAANFTLPPPTATITATRAGAPIRQRDLGTRDATFEQLALIAGQRDTPITVAVADTAMDFRHPLLANSAWVGPDGINGWDFIRNRALSNDMRANHGNGSAVLSAQGTNRIRIMGMTVMADDLNSYDPMFASIDYAIRNGARVINMSFTMQAPEYAERFREVLRQNPTVLFVMASGNQDTNFTGDRARQMGADITAPNLMVVGAANDQGGVWRNSRSGSNTGVPWVTVAARGVDIRTANSLVMARQGTPWLPASGTSVAAPQVANLAAKCMMLSPRLTAADVSRIIVETSDLRAEWVGKNRASGTVNETRAMTVSAVIGMVAQGYDLDRSLDAISSTGEERARIRATVAALMNLRVQ